ncbi:MAG: hypothetical protein A2Z95_01465 [Gallionellales bacterium GWA2_60_18]|nr:MAG: hypothetical protein A2Z95_01465 [Gallionellales bacterium GWA2_60_18]
MLVYSILQALTSSKFWNLGSLDLDCRAGARIATITCGTLAYLEGTETDQANRVAFLQRLLDGIYGCIQRTGSSCFGNISGFCNCIYQIRFIHVSPLCKWLKNRKSPATALYQGFAALVKQLE